MPKATSMQQWRRFCVAIPIRAPNRSVADTFKPILFGVLAKETPIVFGESFLGAAAEMAPRHPQECARWLLGTRRSVQSGVSVQRTQKRAQLPHRGTSLVRKSPQLAPYMYAKTMHRNLWWVLGGGRLFMSEGLLYYVQ